tara:strand:+ start:1093 stop:1974 length:882 start_codon:yes stop_codon:yes gene_type:complete
LKHVNNTIIKNIFFIMDIFIKISKILLVFSFFLFVSKVTLNAHEFWIEPSEYINKNNKIEGHLKVGQNFEGMNLMYNTSDFTKFNILSGSKNKKINVKGVLGDIPALNLKAPLNNLLIIYHETNDKYVNYKKLSKFESFVIEKGQRELIDQHFELNYPKENFLESYRRYAKSLIIINGTSGRDKKTGLLFEFILKNNPYELKDDFISARLFYKKKPLKNQKVTIFSKKNQDKLQIFSLVTDKTGSFEFRVEKGRDYLLDSVMIIPKKGDPKKDEPIWHSDWASLTFTIPESNL